MQRFAIATNGIMHGGHARFRELIATNGYWSDALTSVIVFAKQLHARRWFYYYGT
jgi:hypothetical protein